MSNFRYRLTFGKGRELRFTGHLDLHRAWERTIRRAKLSLAYSEGYRPRSKINIGAALPLGCTSKADLVDFELTNSPDPGELVEGLNGAALPGLLVSNAEAIQAGSPKLQKLITSSEYVIPVAGQDREDLHAKIQALLVAEKLPRVRRDKKYDLRPLIEELSLADPMELRLRLVARSGATGRPDEVLRALEINPDPLVPHRLRLILRDLS